MEIPSFLLNQDMAGLLITLAGQSIMVSLIGLTVIKLLTGRSAPVRSLVCSAAISALGLLLVISIGFRSSSIPWPHTRPPVFGEENTSGPILSPGLDKSLSSPLPFESLSPAPLIQSQSSNEKGMVSSTHFLSSFSIQLAQPISLFINSMGFIWLMGIMFQLIRLGYGVVLVNKFRRSLSAVPDTSFNDMVRTVAGTFWKERLPELYRSPLIESPITIGLFKPIVIIPEKLFDTLSENELKSILLHELSHIYHYDQVMGVIKRVVMALHWWNIVVYKINRDHEQAREEVSDNYVLREIHPRVYTRCLMNLAEKVCLISSFPTAVGMAGRRFDLRVRGEQLLSKKRRVVMNTRWSLKAITFSICLVLTFIIAGLHARVEADAFDDTKTPSAIKSASIVEAAQPLSQKNITEPEVVEASVPANLQATPYSVAMLRAESSNKQVQENVGSIRIPASAGTKPKEIVGKQSDPGIVQSVGDTVLNNETVDTDVLSQKESIVEDAANADEYFSRGVSNLQKGQLDNAVSDFNKAIDLDPQKAIAFTARGSAYFRLNQFDNAISDFNKAIEINPNLAAAYQNRGSVFYRQGQFDDAVSDYSKAIEINPNLAASFLDRGNIYQSQGRFDDAISDYSKAIEINPEFIDAYQNRGAAYYSVADYVYNSMSEDTTSNYRKAMFNYENAISDYDKVIELNPGNSVAYFSRGVVYHWKGSFGRAISDYNKAIALNPENAIAKKNRDYARLLFNSDLRNRFPPHDFQTTTVQTWQEYVNNSMQSW